MLSSAQAEEKAKSERTKAREAFFLEFAATIRHQFPDTPLMVTGGFRSRNAMEAALEADDCDLIGLARPAVLEPHLPEKIIFNSKVADEAAVLYTERVNPPPLIEALGLKSMLTAVTAGAETVRIPKME
jgi:2,4-dienoyl-CoA reductase-like NADH-dependent reductase (Old Yellow Enzyme family)